MKTIVINPDGTESSLTPGQVLAARVYLEDIVALSGSPLLAEIAEVDLEMLPTVWDVIPPRRPNIDGRRFARAERNERAHDKMRRAAKAAKAARRIQRGRR